MGPLDSFVPDGVLFVAMFMLALFMVVGLAVKLNDVKRRREDEAVALQARISDALLCEPSLSRLPITPTVRVPLRPGSPVTVEISGPIPKLELREAVMRLVIREMARTRPDFRLEDRTAVAPSLSERAA